MNKIIFLNILLFLIGCSSINDKNERISIGEYSFLFPSEFNKEVEQGIDSYVGKIKGDSIWLGFDYGYYSDNLIKTPEEYIEHGTWKTIASYQFVEPGKVYSNDDLKIELISYSKVNDSKYDYYTLCKFKDSLFEYPIILPAEIKSHVVKIDTVDGCIRKIIKSKDPSNGITGIYITNPSSFNSSINSELSLSMATSNLTKDEQDTILNIFESVKLIEKK